MAVDPALLAMLLQQHGQPNQALQQPLFGQNMPSQPLSGLSGGVAGMLGQGSPMGFASMLGQGQPMGFASMLGKL